MVTDTKICLIQTVLFLLYCELSRLLKIFHNLRFSMGKCFPDHVRIKKYNSLSNITSLKYRLCHSTDRFYFYFVLILAKAIATHYEQRS